MRELAIAVNLGVNNPKAIDKTYPGRDRAAANLLDDEHDPDDDPLNALGGRGAAPGAARAAYEPGEVEDWAQAAKAAWRQP